MLFGVVRDNEKEKGGKSKPGAGGSQPSLPPNWKTPPLHPPTTHWQGDKFSPMPTTHRPRWVALGQQDNSQEVQGVEGHRVGPRKGLLQPVSDGERLEATGAHQLCIGIPVVQGGGKKYR